MRARIGEHRCSRVLAWVTPQRPWNRAAPDRRAPCFSPPATLHVASGLPFASCSIMRQQRRGSLRKRDSKYSVPADLARDAQPTHASKIARSLKMPLTTGRLPALLLLVSAFFTVDPPSARGHGGSYRGPVVPAPPWAIPAYGPPPGAKGGRTTSGRNPRGTTPTHDLRRCRQSHLL